MILIEYICFSSHLFRSFCTNAGRAAAEEGYSNTASFQFQESYSNLRDVVQLQPTERATVQSQQESVLLQTDEISQNSDETVTMPSFPGSNWSLELGDDEFFPWGPM